jgi:hypothetical protein
VEKPSDALLGKGEQGICSTCHAAGEKGSVAAEQILQAITGLNGKFESAAEILGRAERAGMDVSKARFQLNEAHEHLIQARVLVHSINPPAVQEAVNEGLKITQSSWDAGVAALQEIGYRQRGLLTSLGFIVMAAAGLYLKIRKIENP